VCLQWGFAKNSPQGAPCKDCPNIVFSLTDDQVSIFEPFLGSFPAILLLLWAHSGHVSLLRAIFGRFLVTFLVCLMVDGRSGRHTGRLEPNEADAGAAAKDRRPADKLADPHPDLLTEPQRDRQRPVVQKRLSGPAFYSVLHCFGIYDRTV